MLDDYRQRARQHAPKSLEEMRAAMQRLRAQRFSDHGIAAAVGLAVEQVRLLLGESQN